MCLNLPCPAPVTRATLLSKDCNCWYGNLWTLSFFKLNSLNGELMKVLLDVTNLFQLVESKYFSFASNADVITNFTFMVLGFGVHLLSVYHGRNRLFSSTCKIFVVVILSSPSLGSSPCSNRPPSRLKVPQKRKKEGFGPRADTKITWTTHHIANCSFPISHPTHQ